jgi:hypothetical protein
MLLTQPLAPTLVSQVNKLMYQFVDIEAYEFAEVCRRYLDKGNR